MAQLYANENFPREVVNELRRLGHDVLTTAEAGNAGRAIPDDEVLAFAITEGRAVITHNRRDFIRLHNQNQDHAGIIVCTVDQSIPLAERIHQELIAQKNLYGQLLRINRPQ